MSFGHVSQRQVALRKSAGAPPLRVSPEMPADTAPMRVVLLRERISVMNGTLYKGGVSMWSWVAHRITGVAVLFFLYVHVLDTALVRVSPDAYDAIIASYKTPLVNLMEVGLVGAVLFHALNGLRVMAVDFWKRGPRLQRQML